MPSRSTFQGVLSNPSSTTLHHALYSGNLGYALAGPIKSTNTVRIKAYGEVCGGFMLVFIGRDAHGCCGRRCTLPMT